MLVILSTHCTEELVTNDYELIILRRRRFPYVLPTALQTLGVRIHQDPP